MEKESPNHLLYVIRTFDFYLFVRNKGYMEKESPNHLLYVIRTFEKDYL